MKRIYWLIGGEVLLLMVTISPPRPVKPTEAAAVAFPSLPACTLGGCGERITATDNGRTLTYAVDRRFTLLLNGSENPDAVFSCEPDDMLTAVWKTPPVVPPFYAKTFEINKTGSCVIQSGDFRVKVIATHRI